MAVLDLQMALRWKAHQEQDEEAIEQKVQSGWEDLELELGGLGSEEVRE